MYGCIDAFLSVEVPQCVETVLDVEKLEGRHFINIVLLDDYAQQCSHYFYFKTFWESYRFGKYLNRHFENTQIAKIRRNAKLFGQFKNN